MIALILGGAGAFGLLVWHMQRRPRAPILLSFARLLPDPQPAARPERRFAPTIPVGSVGFWLRMIAAALAMAALLIDRDRMLAAEGEGMALRIVVDVTHSMGLAEGDGSRLVAALAIAAAQVQALGPNGTTTLICAEVVPVGANVRAAGPAGPLLATLAVRPEGGDAGLFMAAALLPSADCPPTHVLVLTDAAQPAGDWADGNPALIWHQIGAPLPNAGIRSVTITLPGLGAPEARIAFEVAVFGAVAPPTLRLDGVSGRTEVPLLPDPSRENMQIGSVPLTQAGAFQAVLTGGGAYDADDTVAFTVPALPQAAVDWRLSGWDRPGNLGAGTALADLVVAPLDTLSPEDMARPLLATYPGWGSDVLFRSVGAFTEDAVLVGALNLDAFENHAPQPFEGPLPDGFVPVLTDGATGYIYIARRVSPPGIILPAPVTDGDEQVANLSLTLFFNALSSLTSGGISQPALDWLDAAGGPVQDAWKESDTARALAAPPVAALTPAPRPAMPSPWTPILILAVLGAILAERLWTLWRTWGRSARAV